MISKEKMIQFGSNNNILYAHGLVNNVMFGTLKRVVKSSWYNNKKNHIIKISTLNNNQLWEVFSTYTIEPESYYITTNFSNDNEFFFMNDFQSHNLAKKNKKKISFKKNS